MKAIDHFPAPLHNLRMPIEPRSNGAYIARLVDDPVLGIDLDSLLNQTLEPAARVILDFSNVRYVNSSNIARLLRLRKFLIQNDGHLTICALGPQVESVFAVTGLDKIFNFAPDTLEVERQTAQ